MTKFGEKVLALRVKNLKKIAAQLPQDVSELEAALYE